MQLIKKWMLQECIIMFSLSSEAFLVCSVHAFNSCCNEQYPKPHPDLELCTAAFFGDIETRQPSQYQDLTKVYHQVAVAGLQFLALVLTHLAHIDVAMPAPQPAPQSAPAVKGSLDSDPLKPAASATGRTAHHSIACVAVTTVTVVPCIWRFAGISR